jgi:putative transposase
MKTVITAKLQLQTTAEQFNTLRQTQLAYRGSLNYVSQYAYAHGKMSNAVRLQEGTYDEIRVRFHLPSQMACSVPRQVGATYKALWSKVNTEHSCQKSRAHQETLQRAGQPT